MKFLPVLLAPLTAILIMVGAACCPQAPPATPTDQSLIAEAERSHVSIFQLALGPEEEILAYVHGSGAVVRLDEGGACWVVSVSHLVDGTMASVPSAEHRTLVFRNEEVAPVDIVCFDPLLQLSVMRFQNRWSSLQAVELSDSKPVVGTPFLLVAAPEGEIIAGRGIVGQYIAAPSGPCLSGPCFLFRSPLIRPGDSGGMIIDENGDLLGLVEATYLYGRGENAPVPWASLAVGIDSVMELLEQCEEAAENAPDE